MTQQPVYLLSVRTNDTLDTVQLLYIINYASR